MLIHEGLMLLEVQGTTKEEIIRELGQKAIEDHRIHDLEMYVKAVLKREEEYSTAVGFGVAIPHGKTDAVKEPFLAYAKVKAIDWNALDGEPVYNVFMIGVPEKEAGNAHLMILAKLSRKLMNEEFRNRLNQSSSKEEVMSLLQEYDLL